MLFALQRFLFFCWNKSKITNIPFVFAYFQNQINTHITKCRIWHEFLIFFLIFTLFNGLSKSKTQVAAASGSNAADRSPLLGLKSKMSKTWRTFSNRGLEQISVMEAGKVWGVTHQPKKSLLYNCRNSWVTVILMIYTWMAFSRLL